MKLTPKANLSAARSIPSSVKSSWAAAFVVVVTVLLQAVSMSAQRSDEAMVLLKEAVHAELEADKTDRSRWRYLDEQQDLKTVSIVVQTDLGSVKRLISRDGRPLTPAEAQQEEERLNQFIHDSSKLAKQRKDGAQDDKSARDLLEMLPDAFLWTIEAENASVVRLHFVPRPDFHPPSLQARVLSAMEGTVVVDKAQHRIETLSGKLTQDVTFGFGIFGRMMKGGTFRVERRELSPGLWQITETHVHIDGKALLFKSIGEQQDEIQTDYKPVPSRTTLEQAVVLSRP